MPKLLREYLQQQQEPFTIDVHLHDRCYHEKGTAKISNFLGKKEKQDETVVQNCSSFLNLVLRQTMSPRRLDSSVNGSQNCPRGEEKGDNYKLSSAGSTNHDAGDMHCSAHADRVLKKRSDMEANKQLSPVSVLQEVESDEGSPIEEQCSSMIIQGKSYSNPTCHQKLKRPKCHIAEGQKQLSDSHSQYTRNKRAMRQSRQLLVDCTSEVIENQRKRDSITKKMMKIDELWRLFCENVWIWSQDYIDETNTIHLVHSEFLASTEEWRKCSDQQRNCIFMEIGDDILDDIIYEIVQAIM